MIELYDWQKPHVRRLERALYNNGAALDASDTGTGKTICALAIAKHFNLGVFVITRKAIIPTWKWWIEEMEILNPHITNYEKARRNGIPNLKNTLYIVDEVHEASGYKTQNANLLIALASLHKPLLMLSATAAHTPLKMFGIGYALELHNGHDFYRWTMNYGCRPNPHIRGAWHFSNQTENMEMLHSVIFPSRGSRMRKAEIPEFPEVTNIVECVELLPPARGIGPYLSQVAEKALEYAERLTLNPNQDSSIDGSLPTCQLVELLYERMKTELDKVSLLIQFGKEALEEGLSPVFFVNFRLTVAALLDLGFPKASSIIGAQDPDTREHEIQKFQSNATRTLIATIDSGGIGVSLHDLHGRYPRISFICPTYRAVSLRQACGRIHRAGARSKAINKLIYAAGTVEEKVARSVQRKLSALDTLNDGDLDTLII